MSADPQTVELDVRPYLRQKQEPFQIIMDTVKTLGPQDAMILHATFKPVPLLGLMESKGFTYKSEQLKEDHWKVTFVPASRKHELESPLPDNLGQSQK